MNKQNTRELLISELTNVYGALTELVNEWDNNAQELFQEFLESGGSWNIPSLDEVHAEIGQYLTFLESRNS